MLCGYCKQEFDDRLNVPRLLILCGHSLCENCCYRMHANNRVDCPECRSSTFIESISLLPKNLALISQSKPKQNQLCTKHSKRYEAFCEKQNQLICIECILQDGHKSHEMDSIHNCFEKNQSRWTKKIDKLQKYLQKLQESLGQNRKYHHQYKDNYNIAKELISKFFKEIREAIDREEENLFNKLRETYTSVDNTYEERIRLASNSLLEITEKIDTFKSWQTYAEIQFLQSYNQRESAYTAINQQPQEPYKAQQISHSKKSILQSISKVLNNLNFDKTEKKLVTGPNQGSLSTQTRKQSQPVSIKAVRKAVPSPIAAVQPFSLNKKKTNGKKDVISAVVVVQGVTAVSRFSDQKEKKQVDFNVFSKDIRSDLSAVDPKESLCHSFMSNMTVFLSERKSIYLVGGFNEQANNIVKLNISNLRWEDVCPLNFNRSKFGSVAVGKQIYVFGGKRGKDRVSDSQMYNAANNKWTKLTPMAKSRSGFAVIALDDLLYFIGGNDGDNILNTVQTLNTATGEWKRREAMNQARDQLAAVVSRNKIYAIGGFGGADSQPLKSVEVYDPKIQKWKTVPSMKEARRALAAAVLADGIYAIGGFDGSLYMNSVQRYDEGDKEWSFVASMKQPRCTHSAVSLFQSQQIYVFGGFDYVPLDTVQRYNVISNEWETVCKMPTARFMHSSLLIREE